MDMTQAKWNTLSKSEKSAQQDTSSLSPQLAPYEGARVEVVDMRGRTRRFIVGRSTGWKPCHLEIARRNSVGGIPADKQYQSVRYLYNAR